MRNRVLRRWVLSGLTVALLVALIPLAVTGQEAAAVRSSFAEPGISPDGTEIAFVSAGDIWTVPASGGDARLLVADPAAESRPLYSPDGRSLAFVSTRTGNGDIYVLTLETGALRRLTWDDAIDQLDGWSRDGRWIYFSSTSQDIGGMQDVYRVPAEGGTPLAVSADRFMAEYWSAPAPDGQAVAFTGRGLGPTQWWRRGHSHIDESEIWLRELGPTGSYRPLTPRRPERGARECWPMWGGDGKTLFYVSDRNGAANIWTRRPDGDTRAVTRFTEGRVLWPSLSADGRTLVFERDFGVWKLDTTSGQPTPVNIRLRGAEPAATTERLTLTDGFEDLALSPDGQKIAFVARGEVFAASAKEGGAAVRLTRTPGAERDPVWSTDSRRVVYASDRPEGRHLAMYDFTARTETLLTSGPGDDDTPLFSPDGKSLLFQRSGKELRVLDLGTRQERVLVTSSLGLPPFVSARPYVWSPDSQWVAVVLPGAKNFHNVHLVPAAGGEARPVTFLAHAWYNSVSWTPDGRSILFASGQRTEDYPILRVDLVPRAPAFREDAFRDLFKDPPATPAPAKKEPVRIEWEGLPERATVLPLGMDVDFQTVTPDGKWVVFIASNLGSQMLWTFPLDALARERAPRPLSTGTGDKTEVWITPDSREAYYLENGRVAIASFESRTARTLALSAEVDVEFSAEKRAMFEEAWTVLRDHFYDPAFHGVDWTAIRARYAPLAAGARTRDELRRLLNLMVGELNASHLGVSAPGSLVTTTGRLGLRFDREAYETAGHLVVTRLVANGPAAIAGVRAGDRLLLVDGQSIGAGVSLDRLLDGKVGRRVELTLGSGEPGAEKRDVVVQPITRLEERNLLYREWVRERREYVARVSGGRLGYVHMADMGQQSLAQLHTDLDTENHSRDGVVIDIRNNNGGFVNAYALDVLTRRPYLTFTRRGFPRVPARTALGQRALEAPTILVTNQHTLSDGEDFTEGYRALKLGKVVGEPTAGWIIYTSSTTLVDGTRVGIPHTRVTDNRGQNMELNPRPVDVQVERPVGESYTGVDSQLDAAVKELLKQIGDRR